MQSGESWSKDDYGDHANVFGKYAEYKNTYSNKNMQKKETDVYTINNRN